MNDPKSLGGLMKQETKKLAKIGVGIFLLFLCIYYWPTAATLIGKLLGAVSPLLIGFAIAYLINILMSFYERHYFPKSKKSTVEKSKRPVCMLLAFLTVLAFVAFVVWLVIPQLVECVHQLLNDFSKGMQEIILSLTEKNILPSNLSELLSAIDWKSKIEQFIGVITSGVGSALTVVINVVSSVFSVITTTLLSIIFSVYLLLGKEKLMGQANRVAKHFIKAPLYERLAHVLSVANQSFHRFIVGQVTEALILGALCTVGMLIFQFPYAPVIGALVSLMALIPIAGAYISAAIGAIIIFTESPVKALLFLVFIIVLQQLEGNLIYPKVVGSSIGLPGIWVLAAVTVGGGIMGITGMLLGVPLAATAYTLLREKLSKASDTPTPEPEPSVDPTTDAPSDEKSE